ncbi:MAG: DNA replication and repair protein RecF [bacterium]|jgi:DNA replication and repair protein RecF|nr:DNA replication and repair protein RecF [candidate division KSB1 bacterium]MDH7561201.1 DNA replication and repair protein RecF [bacterium]
MWLRELGLENFCNYERILVFFASGVNILTGGNAQGKSNIVDAIYYLCFMKGLRGLPDGSVVKFGAGGFLVWGVFAFAGSIEKECRIQYSMEQGKSCYVNRKLIGRRSDLIGNFPVVAMSGDDYLVTKGAPAERRRLMDTFLCQVSPGYVEALRAYTAALKQRNALLRGDWSVETREQMLVWTEQLVSRGTNLMQARRGFVSALSPLVSDYFQCIAGPTWRLHARYSPNVREVEGKTTTEAFFDQLKGVSQRERQFGTTLVGPHRDDIVFEIDGHSLRDFGSRGDHKAALISLCLAEHKLLHEWRGENPILLVDDLLVDLDEKRAARVSRLFPSGTQVILTSTATEAWRTLGLPKGTFRLWRIQQGAIAEVSA